MSFLDLDERLAELSKKVQLVYSPIADMPLPEEADLALIEGAVSNEEQLDLLKKVRERVKVLVALGDCAVTGNATALRNTLDDSAKSVLNRAYIETASTNPQIPTDVPELLEQVCALHEIVKVDCYIPGCPPSPDLIDYALAEILAGRTPRMEGKSKYG